MKCDKGALDVLRKRIKGVGKTLTLERRQYTVMMARVSGMTNLGIKVDLPLRQNLEA